MSQTTIQTFAELVDFISDNDLSTEDINTIVHETVGAYFTTTGSKEDLLQHLISFWCEHGHKTEIPLFIKPIN